MGLLGGGRYLRSVRLTIRFSPPGMFLNDPRLVVTVGDQTVFDGKFKSGFDATVVVAPGDHQIQTAVMIGPLARRQAIPLRLGGAGYRDAKAVEARLSYSRITSNFERRAAISTKA